MKVWNAAYAEVHILVRISTADQDMASTLLVADDRVI